MHWRHIVHRDGDPLLVWLHGLGEHGECFAPSLELPPFDRFAHLIPDLPGYGKTPPLPGSTSFAEVAEALSIELPDYPERFGLIGHSMGAVVALRLAQMARHRVAAFVDVEGNKSAADCNLSGFAAGTDEDQFLTERYPLMLSWLSEQSARDATLAGYLERLAHASVGTLYAHSRELLELSEAEQLARELGALPVDKVFVAGTNGGAAQASLNLVEKAGVPVAKIEKAGHWPFVDQPESFASVVGGWMSRRLLAGSFES